MPIEAILSRAERGELKFFVVFLFCTITFCYLLVWEPRTGWYPLRRAIYNWGPVRTSSALIIVIAFENADFQCFRSSIHANTLSVFIASIWKRSWKGIKTKTHNISYHRERRPTCVCSMRIEFILRRYARFYRFRTFKSGQSKTHQNGSVDANRSMRFRWQRKPLLFGKALVWTGPDLLLKAFQLRKLGWTIILHIFTFVSLCFSGKIPSQLTAQRSLGD